MIDFGECVVAEWRGVAGRLAGEHELLEPGTRAAHRVGQAAQLLGQAVPPGHAAPLGDDAFTEIDHALSQLLSGDGAELAACLADLSKKLPSEVLELVPELRSASGDVAAELASDVRSLLRERLAVGQEGA